MQAAFYGFGGVSADSVFKVCDQPHPLVVQRVLDACSRGEVTSAIDDLKSLWSMGYSALDIINTFFKVVKIWENSSETQKLEFLKALFILINL